MTGSQVSVRRVLLVDDDDDLRLLTSLTLEQMGHWEVDAACSGAEAVQRAAAGQPDVILLDVMMGDMDGPSTLRKLRSQPNTRDIPIIFLTARAHDPEETSHYLAMGAAGVINKPFDPVALPDRIRHILGFSR